MLLGYPKFRDLKLETISYFCAGRPLYRLDYSGRKVRATKGTALLKREISGRG